LQIRQLRSVAIPDTNITQRIRRLTGNIPYPEILVPKLPFVSQKKSVTLPSGTFIG